jgi:ATP-dependent DNA helicase RecG
MPARYEDRRHVIPIGRLAEKRRGDLRGCVVSGFVARFEILRARVKNVHIAAFEVDDSTGRANVTLFGGPKSFFGLCDGVRIIIYGKPRFANGALKFENPEWAILKGGAVLDAQRTAGWARLLPIYPTVRGLNRKLLAGIIYDCVISPELVLTDPLPEEILKKHGFPSIEDAFTGIHAPSSCDDIEPARRRLAYQELYEIQKKIRESIKERKQKNAPSLDTGIPAISALTETLRFELTASQADAVREISNDLRKTAPMHRLLQGDVGSGKTIVAVCAIAQCVKSGYQAAVLVPTTVLCAQFAGECVKYLSPLGVRCRELFSGFSDAPAGDRARLLASLKRGDVDVLIGTHALFNESVEFQSLGLVVIDEQHRFGVRQRNRVGLNYFAGHSLFPHTLMMSATPIPRTLRLAFYGYVDTTVITGKPPGRKPVIMKIVSDNHISDVYRFIADRVMAGERCCWVCGAVGSGEDEETNERVVSVEARAKDIEKRVSEIIRGVKVERLHGRMSGKEKVSVIERFSEGSSQILVSTTVIEVGVDIPEANVMVIEGASGYGLSQLHQIRGRVGRGERAGICLLLDSVKNIRGSRRIEILKNCDDGFAIAEEDLKLRGAGELAGLRQHGDIPLKAADLSRDADLLELVREDLLI